MTPTPLPPTPTHTPAPPIVRYESVGSGQSSAPTTVSTACRRPTPNNIRPDTPDPAAEENFAVAWDPPYLGAEACTLIGYEVRYKEENVGAWERVELGMVNRYGATVEPGLYEVRVSAKYGTPNAQVEAGEVQPPPTPTPEPGCSISATFRADVVRGVSGEWQRSAACVGPVRIEYKRIARHAWEHGIVDAASSFELDGLALVKYRFRAQTLDANGREHWSDVTTLEVRRDPTEPIQVGRPENVRIEADHYYRIQVWWDAPASMPEGKRLTAYYIDLLHEDGSSERVRLRPSDEYFFTYLPDQDGVEYSAQVISELTDSNDVKTLAYSERPDPLEIWWEPFRVWWIDRTPNAGPSQRIYMQVASSVYSSANCYVNGGVINCPPLTLVSLNFAPPGRWVITSVLTGDDLRSTAGGLEDHRGNVYVVGAAWNPAVVLDWPLKHGVAQIGSKAPLYVWESVSNDQIWIAWTPTLGRQRGELGALAGYALFVERHNQVITKEYDSDGAVTSTTTTYEWQDVLDPVLEEAPIYVTDAGATNHVVNIPVLTEDTRDANGVLTRRVTKHPLDVRYTVRAVNLWDHDNDANTTPERVYGGYLELRSLKMGSAGAPSASTSLTVNYPSSGVLDLSWDYPEDGGAAVMFYEVRYRLTDSGDGYTEVRLAPTYRIDDYEYVRFARLSGLSQGKRYDIAVRAVNVNGNGPWAEFRSESGMGIAPD